MDEIQQNILLKLAEASIRYGLVHGKPISPVLEDFAPALREPGASFVTLRRAGDLRGCIGSLSPHRPLVTDVADNAFAAAFQDTRFYPLQAHELSGLELHISILSPAEPMHFSDEQSLLEQLRPGEDGLILEEGYFRGTFLPSVWEQLPTREQFLQHLKLKAGLPPDYWSDMLRVSRYTTQSFGTFIE